MEMRSLKPENRLLQVFIVILFIVLILLSVEFLGSQQMRQEMIDSRNRSYFVTNMSCGHIVNETGEPAQRYGCPSELECFNVEDGKSRCVEPGYEQNYCGKHAISIRLQSEPPKMECNFKYSFRDKVARWLGGGTIMASEPNANLSTIYTSGEETVEIHVESGSFPVYIKDSGDLILTSKNFSRETEKIDSNLTIKGYGKKNTDGYWAEHRKELPLITIPGPALTGLPVEENRSVIILSDGSDSDGDGKTRIENGEEIYLYREETGYKEEKPSYRIIAELKISNNSTNRGYWTTNEE